MNGDRISKTSAARKKAKSARVDEQYQRAQARAAKRAKVATVKQAKEEKKNIPAPVTKGWGGKEKNSTGFMAQAIGDMMPIGKVSLESKSDKNENEQPEEKITNLLETTQITPSTKELLPFNWFGKQTMRREAQKQAQTEKLTAKKGKLVRSGRGVDITEFVPTPLAVLVSLPVIVPSAAFAGKCDFSTPSEAKKIDDTDDDTINNGMVSISDLESEEKREDERIKNAPGGPPKTPLVVYFDKDLINGELDKKNTYIPSESEKSIWNGKTKFEDPLSAVLTASGFTINLAGQQTNTTAEYAFTDIRCFTGESECIFPESIIIGNENEAATTTSTA
ncbi:MAG: hypothetical protein V4691_05380, partial [Pseudomonadota bacterium]